MLIPLVTIFVFLGIVATVGIFYINSQEKKEEEK